MYNVSSRRTHSNQVFIIQFQRELERQRRVNRGQVRHTLELRGVDVRLLAEAVLAAAGMLLNI